MTCLGPVRGLRAPRFRSLKRSVYIIMLKKIFGFVAQLARAPRLHRGGHRFESCRTHQKFKVYYVYVLKKKDNQFYTGYCLDLKRRVKEHGEGKVFTTRSKLPIELVYYRCV